MSRWDFSLKKNEQKNENILEPFGYKFVNEAKNIYGNGDSYLKTEKNINTLNKLNKSDNKKSDTVEINKKLLHKAAWGICVNSFKGLLMNLFVMFMSGGASGIFGIIFIVYSIYNILKSLININDVFKAVENNKTEKFLMQKICFFIMNCLVLLYIMSVCSNSGLLPIRSGDYFYFIPHQKIKQKGVASMF
ncbi:conserved protein, unknown function [Plasmodium reichenowi]|uniref:ER membrane protein complex subunit 4 n=1 Tax=Plasmodium reichenowi TaxID=5854 RepID=A0A060S4S3_PLARE|nr:conserved protein, unknown function [Plasmodium reichenowi]KYN94006.1 conserved protein, unknown function [Plasmodium reichenowi]CDO66821.1 conserved protein, unknown function [Plasmodium reichenowi]